MTTPLKLTANVRRDLKLLFIAKHALGDGSLDSADGNHSPYHHEMRTILEGLFDKLQVANSYETLFTDPGVDFVWPMLNRGGFFNSEMLCPLLCERLGVPYLGANPIQDPLVARYAEYVKAAEALVFVYPTWWSGLPAAMKGWMDRVLVQGVAFGFNDKNRIVPQLGHVRRIAGVTTYGSSRLVTALGADGGRRTLARALRISAGWRTRTTWLGLHRMDTATDEDRRQFLDRVRREFETW